METAILIAAGIFALIIIYFKARRLVYTVKGDHAKSSCSCGNCVNCSGSCTIREIQKTADDSAQK